MCAGQKVHKTHEYDLKFPFFANMVTIDFEFLIFFFVCVMFGLVFFSHAHHLILNTCPFNSLSLWGTKKTSTQSFRLFVIGAIAIFGLRTKQK